MFLRAFISAASLAPFSSDQPMSCRFSCAHTPSTSCFLVTLRFPICPRLVGLPSQHSLDRLHTLLLSAPHGRGWLPNFLPMEHPGLFQKDLLDVLRANHSHVHRHLSLKWQGVLLWPLDAEIPSFADHGSCKSISPNILLPRLLLLSLATKIQTPPCLLLLPSAALTSSFLWARCLRLDLPTLSQQLPRNTSQKNFLTGAIPPSNRKPKHHSSSFSFFFCSQLLLSRSEVHSKFFHTGCKTFSYLLLHS